MPPTEKRGRVHTSTITVAVLQEPAESEVRIHSKDLEVKTCRGSGAGGQHRNTTDSAVQLTHKPSGIMIRVESERSQNQNRESALTLLRIRLQEAEAQKRSKAHNKKRKGQVGSGQRADKRRTIRLQAGQVVDHVTGKKTSAKSYLRGGVDALWA